MRALRLAFVVGLAATLLLVVCCQDDYQVNGWDTREFAPHVAKAWRSTPAGHQRDAGPFESVRRGYLTEASIDSAVDAGFSGFWALFPEFGRPEARIHLTEDYVFWYSGRWAGGADEGEDILLPIFSRGTSTSDPGDQFIKRPPDANWTWWRYTAAPLVPALQHELLHRCIGDPNHGRDEWGRLSGSVSEKASRGARCEALLP